MGEVPRGGVARRFHGSTNLDWWVATLLRLRDEFGAVGDIAAADLTYGIYDWGRTADHRLDDTLLLAARWAAAGNPTELFVAPDTPHAFTGFSCAMTEAWSSARYRWLESICSRVVYHHLGTERRRRCAPGSVAVTRVCLDG
jgi:hypothetical protein